MAIVEAEEHMRKYFANPEPHCHRILKGSTGSTSF